MGQSKAWLPIGGETMLARVVGQMTQVVQPIVLVAAEGQELPPLPIELPIVRDQRPNRGPLEGLAAGLAALVGRVDVAFVTSCDVPLLRPAFITRMLDLLGDHQACVPDVDGLHPLAAVYRVEVLASVRRLLNEDRLRLQTLFELFTTRFVARGELMDIDPDLESLRNVNTPEDLDALR